jgi:hypothetical protein
LGRARRKWRNHVRSDSHNKADSTVTNKITQKRMTGKRKKRIEETEKCEWKMISRQGKRIHTATRRNKIKINVLQLLENFLLGILHLLHNK